MNTPASSEELREFLLPKNKWLYFTIRALRTNGWLYFFMNMLPVLGTYMVGDQAMTWRGILGTTMLAVASGLVAVKAYRSQSPKDKLDAANK